MDQIIFRDHLYRVLQFNQDKKHSFKIQLAQLDIEIECYYPKIVEFFHDYLASFIIPDLKISTDPNELIDTILNVYGDKVNLNDYYDERIAVEFIDAELIALYQKLATHLISYHYLLMHGSVVSKDGYAYMFTAASGVGKTTRTKLFLELYPDAIVVNGDKPLIKITETQVLACGTPWCGKEGWNTNVTVPLRAIFLLERAKEGEESSIEEVSLGKAFPFLLQQTNHPKDSYLMRKTLSLLKELDGKVKIFRFCSTPTTDSVQLAYETAAPHSLGNETTRPM